MLCTRYILEIYILEIKRMKTCNKIVNIKAAIDDATDEEIIYLPVYRRKYIIRKFFTFLGDSIEK